MTLISKRIPLSLIKELLQFEGLKKNLRPKKITESTCNQFLRPAAHSSDLISKIFEHIYLCSEAKLNVFQVSPYLTMLAMQTAHIFPCCPLLAVNIQS